MKTLSNTEREILTLVAKGFSQKQIAAMRGRKHETVRKQIQLLCVKLGALNSPHAVGIGVSLGIVGQITTEG